jgi:hypothetical protein
MRASGARELRVIGADRIDGSSDAGTAAAVDARQDEIMESESAEGRPPTHAQRMSGWRWLAILIPTILLGAGVIALMRGVSVMGIAQFGVVLALLLLIGGLPRWAASMSRGKEEAAARKEAVAEVGGVESGGAGRSGAGVGGVSSGPTVIRTVATGE